MDRVSRVVRSQVMASVRSKGTRLEEQLAAKFIQERLGGFERNPVGIEGRPDFVFRKRKVVVFVDSCFWHGCRWHCRMPATNQRYWDAKIRRNRERDKQVTRRLRQNNWIVVRIWEHSLKEERGMAAALEKIKAKLKIKQADLM